MTARSTGPPDRLSPRSWLQLSVVLALTLIAPLLLRAAQGAAGEAPSRVPYLPVFEGKRQMAFHDHRIDELRRLNPGYVVIGDSMAGSRIDEHVLGRLSGRPVAPLLQAGSGPAFWYLALKNWVIASGIRPRVVFIFFRDTNLTDALFRLGEEFRWSLDLVAGDREEELNQVVELALRSPFQAVHDGIERVYGSSRVRRWLEPMIMRGPATWMTSSRRRQRELLTSANDRFGLDHLRVMEAADMEADSGTDFEAALGRSVLPLMLRDASRAGVALCFVRVQRRPLEDRPPAQSPALRAYIRDLRAYLETHGAGFRDDTGDPAMTLDLYADGDHVAPRAKGRYTTIFFERLSPLFDSAGPRP